MLYGAAWMQSTIASCIAQEAQDTDLFCELQGYLTLPLEPFHSLPDAAVIQWWKDHSIIYPTLTRMAQDFLSIPGSSTASECQFSSAQHIGTNF
jgi:hAT family C-terminal dimerisation region